MSAKNSFRIKLNVNREMIRAFKILQESFENGIRVIISESFEKLDTLYVHFQDEKSGLATTFELVETLSMQNVEFVLPDLHFDNFRKYFGDSIKNSSQEIKMGGLKLLRHSHSIELRCEVIRKSSVLSKVKFRRTA